jgi:hypothetical protein
VSANKSFPHLYVLPEDDANRQLVTGFHLECGKPRQIHTLPVANGWTKVLDQFKKVHIREMNRFPARLMVLLIDFDDHEDRLTVANAAVPRDLTDRVFVLGSWTDPQALRRAGIGAFEAIGAALAKDCREGTRLTWGHELLRHNASELDRLCERIKPILFLAAP